MVKHGINHINFGIASRDILNQLYTASDYFVNTSLADGGPMMLTESLLSYLPAITSDCGLAYDYIQDHVNGFIYPRYDHHKLSEFIRQSLSLNGYKYDKMRLAARSSVMNSTNHHSYISELQKVLESVL